MDFDLHLPLWAIFYSGLIFANALLTINLSLNKTLIYMISQLLSSAFMISFFFIYYGAIEKPSNTLLTLMLIFILFQEIWVNRDLYKRFFLDQIPQEERSVAIIFMGLILIIFLLPFIYISIKVFNF